MKKIGYGIILVLMLILAACGQDDNSDKKKEDTQTTTANNQKEESDMGDNHDDMEHSSTGDIPKGLKTAKDPKYSIGSKAIIETDHMKGMKGAKATIVGAFTTTAYTVSYDPTDGGKRVKNHKWVIQEEIKGTDDKAVKPGDKVTLEADHMKGMKGAKAVIDNVKKTTVYMVDYVPTTGGNEVKNHKWVTEDELSPVK